MCITCLFFHGIFQILKWVEQDLPSLEPVFQDHLLTCTQFAGDVMFIPESWAHGVLNVQTSVAVASEMKGSYFRFDLGLSTLRMLPYASKKKT